MTLRSWDTATPKLEAGLRWLGKPSEWSTPALILFEWMARHMAQGMREELARRGVTPRNQT